MATNIVEAVRKRMGYAPLDKVDPNIQEIRQSVERSPLEKLSQASIPAVLAALYIYTRGEKESLTIVDDKDDDNWLDMIYGGKQHEAAEKVANYAGVTVAQAESHMETIAKESVAALQEAVGANAGSDKMRSYMNSQRHNILVHLPAALKLGDTLNDEGIDDRTNKMEGPVSNFMHKIENTFSEEDKTKATRF